MIIGLIPCAGRAERLHGLPKYLLPLPDGFLLKNISTLVDRADTDVRIGTSYASHALLKSFMPSDWLKIVGNTQSINETLLTLIWSDLIKETNHNVVMAMPDTYWTPEPDLFSEMIQRLEVADVVLAVWQQRESQRGLLGTVDLDGTNVRKVVDKDPFSPHPFIWGAMAWRPTFWKYVRPEHPHLGIAINAAIVGGLKARAVIATGEYYDAGTFEGYAELCHALTKERTRATL